MKPYQYQPGVLARSYQPEVFSPLRTDLYELNMADAFNGLGRMDDQASFYFHWRKPAFSKNGEGYTTSVGLEGVIDYFEHFKFSPSDVTFLKGLKGRDGKPLLNPESVDKMAGKNLEVSLHAMPEGTPVAGAYPDLRIDGPLDQVLIAETLMMLLNNPQSNVATRASRLMEASGGQPVAAMGLRRSAGLGFETPRASFIGGTTGLADVGAAKELGLGDHLVGTMAHLFVQSHQEEGITNKEAEFNAFVNWLKQKPGSSVLLVDTFDVKQGIENAIAAAKATGVPLMGMRVDTGDKEELLRWANYMDDRLAEESAIENAAGAAPKLFEHTGVYLTNDLDEYKIDWMRRTNMAERGNWSQRFRFGVGTQLENPGPLGGVYKMTAYETKVSPEGVATQLVDAPEVQVIRTMKIGGVDRSDPANPKPSVKSSLPGVALNSVRLRDDKGNIIGDVIVDTDFWDKQSPAETQQAWAERNIRETGFFIDMNGKRTEVPLPNFATAELMLHKVYDHGKLVYQWPYEGEQLTSAYEGGPFVTNLPAIQAYGIAQRKALPDAVRRIEAAERLPLFLDPRIQREQLRIIEKMSEMPAQPKTRDIDVLIDVQNGFSKHGIPNDKGGSLYVPGGEKSAEKVGQMIEHTRDGIFILSQDFHPADHISFETNHPGVMQYRVEAYKKLLAEHGQPIPSNESVLYDQAQQPVHFFNGPDQPPVALPFNELVLDRQGLILGIKEHDAEHGDRVRQVTLVSREGKTAAEGFVPSEADKGRVAEVLDTYLDTPFHALKGITTQMLWSPHCVAGTYSAEFDPAMKLPKALTDLLRSDVTSPDLEYVDPATGNHFYVVRKGMSSEMDSYGIGLENDKKTRTTADRVFQKIAESLQDDDYQKANVNIGGLASNFCVEFSHNNVCDLFKPALRLLGIGTQVNYLADISNGIPIPGGVNDPFSLEGAAQRMVNYGARSGDSATQVRSSADILRQRTPHPVAHGTAAISGDTPSAQQAR